MRMSGRRTPRRKLTHPDAVAETQEIITKFTADVTSFEEGVETYEKGLTDATKASDKFDASQKQLGGTTGSLGDKFKGVQISAERAAKGIAQVGNETKKAGAQTGIMGKLQGAFTSIGNSVKSAGTGIKGFFSEIGQGVSRSIPSIGGLGGAFGGIVNPITLAAGAVVGLIANLTRLDSVKVFVDGVKIAFDGLLGRLTSFEGIGSIITGTGIQQEAIQAAAFTKILDAMEEKQRQVNIANAESQKQLASLNQTVRDRTKTEQERVDAADKITKIEERRAAQEVELARDKLGFAQLQIDAEKRRGVSEANINDELLNARADALTNLRNAEAASIQLLETTERRKNAILEEGINDRAKIEAKGIADGQKADAALAQRTQVISTQEAALTATLTGLVDQRATIQATADEKEVLAVEKKYRDIEAKTREGFAKVAEASAPEDRAALAQREADFILQITATKNAELAALDKQRADNAAKLKEEDLERLRTSLLTETELQREAVLTRLDEDIALADQRLETEEEREAFRLERTKQAEKEITGIITEEQQKRLDADQAAADARVAQLEEQNAAIATLASDGLAIITSAAASGNASVEDASKALITLLLDTVEKIVTMNAVAAATGAIAGNAAAGPLGVTKGLLEAALITGIIKGLFATLKANIAGAYLGEERIGANGERPMLPGTRDRYLRRVHKNEGIVDAKTNMENLDAINAMRKGKFDDYVMDNYNFPSMLSAPLIEVLAFNDDRRVTEYLGTDTGQRIAASMMLPRHFDLNMVKTGEQTNKTLRQTNALLASIAQNFRPTSKRHW